VATFPIREFGDPVLKERCAEVTAIDGALVRLANDMIETMYAAPGVGLAANQVGVQKRLFVYDVGDDTELGPDPHAVVHQVAPRQTQLRRRGFDRAWHKGPAPSSSLVRLRDDEGHVVSRVHERPQRRDRGLRRPKEDQAQFQTSRRL